MTYGSIQGIIGTISNHSLELRTNNTYRVGVSTAGVVNIANLTGTGSRMVVADAAGNLSTQAIPTSAVSSVFGRTGAVVAASGDYTTSQVTEGTNLYYTDARSRAAITLTTTGSSGAATYSGGTLNIPTYTLAGLGGQLALSGTGFVKISGTTISYDNSTYLTTSSAASTYLPLAGGTLTGALNGTTAAFSGTYSGGGTVNIMTWQRLGGAVAADMTYNDANTSMNFGTSTAHSLNIKTNNTTALSIASTGAATFSSSVTATSGLNVGSGTAGRNAFSQSDFRIAAPNDTNILNGIAANTSMTIKTDYYGGGSATPLILQSAANSNQLYLATSGNVGINTASPISILDVQVGPSSRRFLVNYDDSLITIKGASSNGSPEILRLIGDGIRFNVGSTGSGSEAMRISSDGHLGLGVTPSAWSAYTALQIKNSAYYAYSVSGTHITGVGSNIYYDGSQNTYIGNGYASTYLQLSGEHRFYTAPSGTAGNAITLTQSMTLAANSGLSIGTTTAAPANGLLVAGDAKVKTLEVTNVGTYGASSGISTYMQITVNGQNYVIPLHGTP
jgi:hypothetical protein